MPPRRSLLRRMKQKGTQRRPLPRLEAKGKSPALPWEGCTGPDVDRHALRGDGRSFAGREGLSRFFINNREAYWFRLPHNSLKQNRFEETLCGNSMCYSLFYVSRKDARRGNLRRIARNSRHALRAFVFTTHAALPASARQEPRGEASNLECDHRQFDVKPSRGTCFARFFIAVL